MKNAFLISFVLLFVVAFAFADTGINKDEMYKAIDRFEAGYTLTGAEYKLLKFAGYNFDLVGTPVIDYAGGPDAYGYIFKDSDEPDGPTYSWVDITGTGTDVTGALSDDSIVGPFPIGFSFPLYGSTYTDFWVNSNGTIVFDGTYISLSNYQHPTLTPDVPFLSWFWDDLDPANGADGQVFYETMMIGPNNALVIEFFQYDEYPNGPDAPNVTAEVILFDDGRILMQYNEFTGAFDYAGGTIGIQADGTTGLDVLYNGSVPNYPFANLAIEYSILPGDADVSGVVTDAGTGDPIAGANVLIGNGIDVTDGAGSYEILDQFSGDNNVEISAAGYFTFYGSVVLDPGMNDYDFQMEALPPPVQGDYFSDFEADQGFFSGSGTWEWGTPTASPTFAYSGTNCWATVLGGNYNNNDDDWLISVTSFVANDAAATLTYFHYLDYENSWDGYNVQTSTDGGNTWQVINPVGGYPDDAIVGLDNEPGFTQGSPWTEVTFDMGAYVGVPFWLAFRHGTDSSVNTYSGAAIDDVFFYAGREYEVILTPLSGYTIGASGGVFTYSAELINNTGSAIIMDGWTWAGLPDGNLYGPLSQVNLNIAPGSTNVPQLGLQVPGWAPEGLYTFHAAIGQFPNVIASEDMFWFWKVGFGAAEGEWADTPWDLAIAGLSTPLEVPAAYEVTTAYPNPFNPTATIEIALPETADLKVNVYNVTGQMVAELANGQFSAGSHELVIDGSALASGVYFVHTQVPGQVNNMQKITLLK
jgi:Secretion system C-terminal sorting domain/Immune inhibitor A-like, MAM domain/Carboxypeptidase regulatory-like domain